MRDSLGSTSALITTVSKTSFPGFLHYIFAHVHAGPIRATSMPSIFEFGLELSVVVLRLPGRA